MQPFESIREVMEKQYEDAVFDPASGWDQSRIREVFLDHCAKHPGEPRIITKAFLSRLLLEHARIAVEPDSPFTGKVEGRELVLENRSRWLKEAWARVDRTQMADLTSGFDPKHGVGYMVDFSHVAPDWEAVLKLGLPGLRDRLTQSPDSDFRTAGLMIYDGALALARRMGEAARNPALLAIAERPPQTLHEAFQLAYFYHEVGELEGISIRTMGWFDRLYIDYYRNDLATGRLDQDSAEELIKYFWILFYAKHQGLLNGKNFCFGPEINELSYLGMEVYHQMNVVDPKLSVRVDERTPDDFLRLVARNIRDGRNGIVMLNDPVVEKGLIAHGRTPEDAHNYIPIGCYEPAVMGKEVSLSGASFVYLPAILSLMLQEQCDYTEFEELKRAFLDRIRRETAFMEEMQCRCEDLWPSINPAPFLSGSFARCVAVGKDYSEGGLEYNNTGCTVCYIAEAVDSLAAIDYLVYRKKLCTLAQLRRALAADWKGYEPLQQIVRKRPPKWGNNDPAVDALAVEIADFIAPLINQAPNRRGGKFFAAIYGQLVVNNGKRIAALPDGRNAGEPVSKNMDACIGMDKRGITALMNSTTKIDFTRFACGTCLDLMLHPSSVSGEDGIAVIVALIRSFLAQGGSGLQFNIFDGELLKDAQKHPEKYENLQVRVCGWNAKFNDLSLEEQNTFIRQAEAMA